MPTRNGHHRQNESTFNQATLQSDGGPAGSRTSRRKLNTCGKPIKTLSGMARLRIENQVLRSQIARLQTQWDSLKTTLGLLSTTVCSHETF